MSLFKKNVLKVPTVQLVVDPQYQRPLDPNRPQSRKPWPSSSTPPSAGTVGERQPGSVVEVAPPASLAISYDEDQRNSIMVGNSLRLLVQGAGLHQETFDRVIALLIQASGTSPGRTEDQRRLDVAHVQHLNDGMEDDEALAWFRRALELTF